MKNTFLITRKNYPVPPRRDAFHNRNLAFTNKESHLSRTIFSNIIASSRQSGPKLMFMSLLKACKQSPLHSKLKKIYFCMRKYGCTEHFLSGGMNFVKSVDVKTVYKEDLWNHEFNYHPQSVFCQTLQKSMKTSCLKALFIYLFILFIFDNVFNNAVVRWLSLLRDFIQQSLN